MKKIILLILLLIICIGGNISAQTLSPLFPFVTSNQIIERPALFRNLQNNIGNNIKDLKPGLRVDKLYKEITGLKENIKKMFEYSSEITNEKYFKISISGIGFVIKEFVIKDSLLKSIKDSLKDTVKTEIKNYISNGINSFSSNEEFKNLILDLMIVGFKVNVETESLSVEDKVTIVSDKIIEEILVKVLSKIKNDITIEKPEGNNPSEYNSFIYNVLGKLIDPVKSEVDKIVNSAEKQIYDALENLNSVFISGNLGLAISEGEGDFSGGTQVSFKMGNCLQTGLYLNSQVNSNVKDSINPDLMVYPKSLIGLQLRSAIGDNCEIAFLGSLYFKDAQYKNSGAYEFGGGLSFNNNNYIFGASLFLFRNVNNYEDSADRLSYGLFVKAASPKSPTFFVGMAQLQGINERKFGVKLIYPIF